MNIELLMNLIGISGAIVGVVSWWRGAIEKQYAARQAFNSLSERQAILESSVSGLIEAINEWHKCNDERLDRIENILAHNEAMLSQHDQLLQTLINSQVTQR